MKRNSFIQFFCIIFFAALCIPSFAQDDNQQQPSQGQRPNFGGRGGMMNFKHSPLEGVWQACNITEEGGSVKMQLIPCLKMVGFNGQYQDITVKVSSEGSKVTENGMYVQVNDSTYRREITSCSDTVAAKKYKKEINISRQGDNLLIISFTSNDGKDSYLEVWKRISTSAPFSMSRGGGHSGYNRSQVGQSNSQSSGNSSRRSSSQRRSSSSSSNNAFQDEMNSAIQSMGNDDSF